MYCFFHDLLEQWFSFKFSLIYFIWDTNICFASSMVTVQTEIKDAVGR